MKSVCSIIYGSTFLPVKKKKLMKYCVDLEKKDSYGES